MNQIARSVAIPIQAQHNLAKTLNMQTHCKIITTSTQPIQTSPSPTDVLFHYSAAGDPCVLADLTPQLFVLSQ